MFNPRKVIGVCNDIKYYNLWMCSYYNHIFGTALLVGETTGWKLYSSFTDKIIPCSTVHLEKQTGASQEIYTFYVTQRFTAVTQSPYVG
jgi:hypothetical protein